MGKVKNDSLGDICKYFEKNFTLEQMIPELPVIIRLDGNNFHNWTKGLERPFDKRLSDLMIDTTKFLVKETNAVIGYCQSDEITLILYSNDIKSAIYQDGKKQKILSKLTAKLVNHFNRVKADYGLEKKDQAVFDCRIFQVPTLDWAVKQLLWREQDASKNSISMAARSFFSHNSIHKLNGDEMQEKMFTEEGVNWNDYPAFFKRGTYVKRVKTSRKLTEDELKELPAKHKARQNPDLEIERNIITVCDMPKFSSIINKVGVVFFNEEPQLKYNNVTV